MVFISISYLNTLISHIIPLDNDSFKKSVRCLIPNTVIPKNVVREIIEWIFDLQTDVTAPDFNKIEYLLVWIASTSYYLKHCKIFASIESVT